MSSEPTLYAFPTPAALAANLRKYILQAQNAALARHDRFRIAVSGGSLPKTLAQALLSPPEGTTPDEKLGGGPQFNRWDIFFADERCVPLDHADSNYALLKSEWLDKIPASMSQPVVHTINASLITSSSSDEEDSADPQEIADQYQESLTRAFAAKDSVKLPVFDLLLLGCGPDGHTCSLFPGHELLREADAWVVPIGDSPKPPRKRITLTLPVVTHGARVAFVATGEGKREVLVKVFDKEGEEGRELPAAIVNRRAGDRVSWFVDEVAAGEVGFPKKSSL